jgi:hypothetical protein
MTAGYRIKMDSGRGDAEWWRAEGAIDAKDRR